MFTFGSDILAACTEVVMGGLVCGVLGARGLGLGRVGAWRGWLLVRVAGGLGGGWPAWLWWGGEAGEGGPAPFAGAGREPGGGALGVAGLAGVPGGEDALVAGCEQARDP